MNTGYEPEGTIRGNELQVAPCGGAPAYTLKFADFRTALRYAKNTRVVLVKNSELSGKRRTAR